MGSHIGRAQVETLTLISVPIQLLNNIEASIVESEFELPFRPIPIPRKNWISIHNIFENMNTNIV